MILIRNKCVFLLYNALVNKDGSKHYLTLKLIAEANQTFKNIDVYIRGRLERVFSYW